MSPYEDFKKSLSSLEETDETNYLIEVIDYCCDQMNVYGDGDIRHDYFELVKDVLINYSLNLKNFWLRAFLKFEETIDIQFLNQQSEDYFKGKFDPVHHRYRSLNVGLTRSLIIEFWSLFEYAISIVFEHLFKEEIHNTKHKYYKSFKKVLKKHISELPQELLEEITNELCSKTDSFIPTLNKVNKIFKRSGGDYKGREEDMKFLQFFGRLRNGIHCNFIYKGPNKEPFEFEGNTYQFEDGKMIVENLKKPFDEMKLINQLLLVILRFFESLEIEEPIQNWVTNEN